jgi:hypothetical protein
MQSKNIIIKKLIEYLSKTSIAHDIRYILESKEEVNSRTRTLLEHIIKLEIIKDPNPRNGWKKTIYNTCDKIFYNDWFIDLNKKNRDSILLSRVNKFDLEYNRVKNNWNIKNVNTINKETMPEKCDDIIKNKIKIKYNNISEYLILNRTITIEYIHELFIK